MCVILDNIVSLWLVNLSRCESGKVKPDISIFYRDSHNPDLTTYQSRSVSVAIRSGFVGIFAEITF